MDKYAEVNGDDEEDVVVLQLPAEDEVLLQKLREESRAVFLQRKSRELLDNEELQVTRQLKEARACFLIYFFQGATHCSLPAVRFKSFLPSTG